jgi:hypothetical protein
MLFIFESPFKGRLWSHPLNIGQTSRIREHRPDAVILRVHNLTILRAASATALLFLSPVGDNLQFAGKPVLKSYLRKSRSTIAAQLRPGNPVTPPPG